MRQRSRKLFFAIFVVRYAKGRCGGHQWNGKVRCRVPRSIAFAGLRFANHLYLFRVVAPTLMTERQTLLRSTIAKAKEVVRREALMG